MRLLFSFLLTICCSVAVASASQEVALLHSVPKATPWTDEVASGLRSSLGDSASVSEIFIGSPLDDDDHFETRFEQLQSTWGASRPAVVVTDGELAFAFMRKYREDLFVGSPLVYCGMARPDSDYLEQCGDCTGLPLQWGVRETVDMIFSLRPTTTTVVGIIDGSQQSAVFRKMAEEAMEPYLEHAQIIFPGHEPGDEQGLDVEGLRDVAASVPRAGAVLFLRFEETNQGDYVDSLDAFQAVAMKSDAPVFVLSSGVMKRLPGSAVGGAVVSGYTQGQAVGLAVSSLMQGDSVSEMLLESVPPRPVLDVTALARFGLAQTVIADGTQRINSPDIPDTDERISSTGLVGGFVGLTVLAVLFFIIRRKRR